jgi:hypothetical protein
MGGGIGKRGLRRTHMSRKEGGIQTWDHSFLHRAPHSSMDYPRNPAPPKEKVQEIRPSLDLVYTPGFTVPGGKSGLTLDEYQDEIFRHDPLVKRCVNKFKWHLLSVGIISGIGGRYFAKRS